MSDAREVSRASDVPHATHRAEPGARAATGTGTGTGNATGAATRTGTGATTGTGTPTGDGPGIGTRTGTVTGYGTVTGTGSCDDAAARWRDARRILCIRLDSLGDVLMCTPAMRALRHGAPGRHLTLLSSASGAAVAPCIPELDAALAIEVPWVKPAAAVGDGGRAAPPSLQQAAAELRRHAFDGAVIFTSYSQSALPAAMLCHQAGIALRLAACRENPYALLTDWVPEPERERAVRHEVRRQLDLVGAIGCTTSDTRLSFQLPEDAGASLDALLDRAGIDASRPFLVLHPGASAPSRRYPARHWPALLRLLAGMGHQLVLTGDAAEAHAIDAIVAGARNGGGSGARNGAGSGAGSEARNGAGSGSISGAGSEVGPDSGVRTVPGAPVRSLAGRLSLPQLGLLLRRARLLVANNTGPAHIAAAVGTPVVSLYAMTNPQHTPWQVAQRVLYHPVDCRDCLRSTCPQAHHACLDLLAPKTIAAAVAALLDDTAARPAHRTGTMLAYD